MIDTGDIDVFLGLDVRKGEHHTTAVTPAGKKALDKRLPNTEPKLRELFAKLQARPCSASPDAGQMSSSRCSGTEPSTNHKPSGRSLRRPSALTAYVRRVGWP